MAIQLSPSIRTANRRSLAASCRRLETNYLGRAASPSYIVKKPPRSTTGSCDQPGPHPVPFNLVHPLAHDDIWHNPGSQCIVAATNSPKLPSMWYRGKNMKYQRWLGYLDDWYLCIGHWSLFCFVIGSPLAFPVAVWLIPSLRIPGLLYVAWLCYDRHTPYIGGRRFEFMRNLRFWNYRREYFPIRLVSSVPLPADRTYLFATFPHGLFVLGASTNFCSDTNAFSRLFPGLVPYVATLNSNYWWPIGRDIFLAFGCCSASKDSILHVLNGTPGNVCVLLVGGMAEIVKSVPDTYVIILRNRKGFVRTALEAGSALVPVFSFGEPNAFDQPRSNWYLRLQEASRSWTKAPFVFFKGRTVLGGIYSLLPHHRPITTVVGGPIQLPKVENPSEELVDHYHEQFVSKLQALFDQYKGQYDDGKGCDATLVIE